MASRDVVRLVDAQARQRERVTESVVEAVTRLVLRWPDFYTPEMVAKFVTAMVRLIEPAQERTASTTSAYLARVISEMRGRPVEPVPVRLNPMRLRRNTEHRAVVERVAAEFRRHVANDLDEDEARERAAHRARVIVNEDLGLAQREAARQVFTRTRGITGYRRVIHPELSQSGTCGLCIAASDRVYSTGELMPIHALCKCEPLPIIGANDPGRSLNKDELEALYGSAGGADASKLSRVRYQVSEHGELGPVLHNADHDFRGPDDVPTAA